MLLLGLYIPSLEGAIQALLIQTVLLGALALALGAYARQYIPMRWVIISLLLGLITGLAGTFIYYSGKNTPGVVTSDEVLAYFELYVSAVAGAGGLLLGSAVLLIIFVLTKTTKLIIGHQGRQNAANKA